MFQVALKVAGGELIIHMYFYVLAMPQRNETYDAQGIHNSIFNKHYFLKLIIIIINLLDALRKKYTVFSWNIFKIHRYSNWT